MLPGGHVRLGIGGRRQQPSNQDRYLIVLYDASGRVLYDWEDLTTVGLGDVVVRAG